MDIKFKHTFPMYKPQWVMHAYDAAGNKLEIKKEEVETIDNSANIIMAKDKIYDI